MPRVHTGKGKGKVGRVARRSAFTALALAAGLVLIGAAWVTYTQLALSVRESQSAEKLAAGRGRWVATPDASLYVQEWGDPAAPVMLLTHGTGAWSGTWFTLPATLAAAGWHVVAVDLPPFGLSTTLGQRKTVDYSRAAQATRISSLIDTLPKPVTLVGHSFGAGPALEAAMRSGDSLRQLVLVDPALGLGPLGEPPHCDTDSELGGPLAVRALRTSLVGATATWPGLSATLLRQFVHRKEVVTEQLVSAYQIPFARESFSARLGDWAAGFARASCESAESLDPAKLATWSQAGPQIALIWGEEDTITPIAQGKALQRWMPNAKMTTLPGVGHIPHIENPEAFAAALLAATHPAR
jgi:pimeloyl-ACP methyl ester carboxylesterase